MNVKFNLTNLIKRINASLPYIGFAMGAESLRIAVIERHARLEQVKSEVAQLKERVEFLSDKLEKNELIRNRISELIERGNRHLNHFSENDALTKSLIKRIQGSNVSDIENEILDEMSTQLTKNQTESAESLRDVFKDMVDTLDGVDFYPRDYFEGILN
jgi:hypothetical protein